MGKRPAEVELFMGNMVSMRREDAASMQREEPFAMATERGHIAAKFRLRCESTSDERSAGNLHAAISGSRGRVTFPATRSGNGRPPPATRWVPGNWYPYRDR